MLGEHDEAVTALLGDERTARMIRLGRMYALVNLGRLDEALTLGEELTRSSWGPRATDAKIIADVADTMIQIGRIDDGLHHLAQALLLLETAPRDRRYISAMSSLCKAASSAELFELADDCIRTARDAFEDDIYRSSADLQRAELLLEWALRLEQVDRAEEAGTLYAISITLLEYWAARDLDGPLGAAHRIDVDHLGPLFAGPVEHLAQQAGVPGIVLDQQQRLDMVGLRFHPRACLCCGSLACWNQNSSMLLTNSSKASSWTGLLR